MWWAFRMKVWGMVAAFVVVHKESKLGSELDKG